MLYDNHNRIINYLRLAVTDRCNLRCFYCMPENGIQYVPQKELLTYEEMLRLAQLLAPLGIHKIRITGGEPFLRKDMYYFLRDLTQIKGIKEVHVTTNGTMTEALIPKLQEIGIRSINLSLDTLDENRFFEITRRNVFSQVRQTLDALVESGLPTKINMVVMQQHNIQDIIPMVELGKKYSINIRFIEEMPFNGTSRHETITWNYKKILSHIQSIYPNIEKLKDSKFSTSYNYKIQGFKGTFGIIAAYSRTFCGTCNRIRLTPKGMLKTCLYDDGVFNIKNIMRAGASDQQIQQTFLDALGNRAKDGFEAEQNRRLGGIGESMSTIGG